MIITLQNKELFTQYASPFYQVFGVSLIDYWDKITGLDVITFDKHIQPHRDESSFEAIQRQWGDKGVGLIKTLIGANPQAESNSGQGSE